MAELLIRDENIARRLLNLASRDNRSVEDFLDDLLNSYESAPTQPYDADAEVKRYRRKLYAEARKYWQRVGDSERLKLTDEDLDEQFWLFDAEGIPRLKSEEGTIEIPPGTGPHVAALIDQLAFETENPIDPAQADDILNAEFADYLIKRMNDGA